MGVDCAFYLILTNESKENINKLFDAIITDVATCKVDSVSWADPFGGNFKISNFPGSIYKEGVTFESLKASIRYDMKEPDIEKHFAQTNSLFAYCWIRQTKKGVIEVHDGNRKRLNLNYQISMLKYLDDLAFRILERKYTSFVLGDNCTLDELEIKVDDPQFNPARYRPTEEQLEEQIREEEERENWNKYLEAEKEEEEEEEEEARNEINNRDN